MRNLLKLGLVLAGICFISSLFLGVVYNNTRPKIAAERAREEKEALTYCLPEAKGGFDAVRVEDKILYYKGYSDVAKMRVAGFVFNISTRGYSSQIDIMVGLTPKGGIAGLKVLRQEETPGLGARVTEVLQNRTLWEAFKKGSRGELARPWFEEQFRMKKAHDLPAGIQAITGATITSRAIINSVKLRCEELMRQVNL